MSVYSCRVIRCDSLVASGGVEQAQLDLGGVLGEEGEIDPGAVPGGAEGIGLSRPDSHRVYSASAALGCIGIILMACRPLSISVGQAFQPDIRTTSGWKA